jgi:hypothetical protein
MPTIFLGYVIGGVWVMGFFGVEGLDTPICWGFRGGMERKKDPGLKPLDSMRLIQGLKPPAPSG